MDGKALAEKIKARWLDMDIQRSGTDGAELWMMVQDLLAIIRNLMLPDEYEAEMSTLKDRLESMKIERDVFQKENHRLLSIMVEKGWLTNG